MEVEPILESGGGAQEPGPKPKVLLARLRVRSGTINDVPVLDLSLGGCMIDRRGLVLKLDERALIKLPGLALMPCYVLWIEERRVGLQFERPLYEPVLHHLYRTCAQGAVT